MLALLEFCRHHCHHLLRTGRRQQVFERLCHEVLGSSITHTVLLAVREGRYFRRRESPSSRTSAKSAGSRYMYGCQRLDGCGG
jgi:hypothetical protein